MRKILLSLAFATALIWSTGCIQTQTGAPVGGLPTKDTIHDRYEKPVPMLVKAVREVLRRNGKVLVDNVANNTFQAKVNQRNVWVSVVAVDSKITAVSIQARGPMGGDIYLASDLSKQIALQLMAEQSQ